LGAITSAGSGLCAGAGLALGLGCGLSLRLGLGLGLGLGRRLLDGVVLLSRRLLGHDVLGRSRSLVGRFGLLVGFFVSHL
jgi:hypothetical protein